VSFPDTETNKRRGEGEVAEKGGVSGVFMEAEVMGKKIQKNQP